MIRRKHRIFWAVLCMACLSSCLEKLDDEYLYTFTGETVMDYLKNRPETYSSFSRILVRANVSSLLATRGSYTCFAPTNEAFDDYFRQMGIAGPDALTDEEAQKLVYGHLLSRSYLTTDLSEGAIPVANMNDRYLMVSFQTINDTTLAVLINKKSQIILKDAIQVNGVVHTMNQVLSPSNSLLPDLMAENPEISIFTEALFLTGLSDSIRRYMDEEWEPMPYIKQKKSYRTRARQPEKRYYGYTALVEPDEVYKANQINSLDDLKAYAKAVNDRMYPDDHGQYDEDWTNPRNPLNRFVSYHLLPRTIYYNNFYCRLGTVSGCESYDFFETLNHTLIRTCNANGISINRSFTMPETGMRHNGINGVKVQPWRSDTYEQSAINGIYHYINGILVYDETVRDGVLNERIRIDLAGLLPEMMNNNLRAGNDRLAHTVFAFDDSYFDDLSASKDTRIFYQSVMLGEVHYQQDAFFFEGVYDVTLRLPPVPEGVYEVRVGIRGVNLYGIAQFYVDSQPCGIPLDLSVYGHPWGWPAWDDGHINWEEDYYVDPSGNLMYLPDVSASLDKSYRNKGFMRGPAGVCMWPNQTVNRQFRWYRAQYRKIVVTMNLTEGESHYLRIKSVLEDDDKQGMIDYIELCPKSIYDAEGGEDIY
jgi:uncharacterized surface protein with fasciclin (FAS1) repeats